MKYNVFLSKNTKDYKEAVKLLSFLERSGLKVFESQQSLPRVGIADYAKAIDDALEQSENLIVLFSPNELGTGEGDNSSWVYYEWTSFRNELLSKRKKGNLLSVLCNGVNISMLPFGLRKYQAFELAVIENSNLLEYIINKSNNDYYDRISSFERSNSVAEDLKFFDFGHHFSVCMFAKIQNKDDFMGLLQEDLDGFVKLTWKDPHQIISINPDEIVKEIKKDYGDIAADIFSLGNYCGILTSMALFVILGATEALKQLQSLLVTFKSIADSLGVPESVVSSFITMINEKDQQSITNYFKIVRRAIAIRHEISKQCPHCGIMTSIEKDKCPNCMNPL